MDHRIILSVKTTETTTAKTISLASVTKLLQATASSLSCQTSPCLTCPLMHRMSRNGGTGVDFWVFITFGKVYGCRLNDNELNFLIVLNEMFNTSLCLFPTAPYLLHYLLFLVLNAVITCMHVYKQLFNMFK